MACYSKFGFSLEVKKIGGMSRNVFLPSELSKHNNYEIWEFNINKTTKIDTSMWNLRQLMITLSNLR